MNYLKITVTAKFPYPYLEMIALMKSRKNPTHNTMSLIVNHTLEYH